MRYLGCISLYRPLMESSPGLPEGRRGERAGASMGAGGRCVTGVGVGSDATVASSGE